VAERRDGGEDAVASAATLLLLSVEPARGQYHDGKEILGTVAVVVGEDNDQLTAWSSDLLFMGLR